MLRLRTASNYGGKRRGGERPLVGSWKPFSAHRCARSNPSSRTETISALRRTRATGWFNAPSTP